MAGVDRVGLAAAVGRAVVVGVGAVAAIAAPTACRLPRSPFAGRSIRREPLRDLVRIAPAKPALGA